MVEKLRELQEYQGWEKDNLDRVEAGDYIATEGMSRYDWRIEQVTRVTATQVIVGDKRYTKHTGKLIGGYSLNFQSALALSQKSWHNSPIQYERIKELHLMERWRDIRQLFSKTVKDEAEKRLPKEGVNYWTVAASLLLDPSLAKVIEEKFPDDYVQVLGPALDMLVRTLLDIDLEIFSWTTPDLLISLLQRISEVDEFTKSSSLD